MTVRTSQQEAAADGLPAQLRAAGLKPTRNLLAVLSVLAAAGGGWMGGEDVYRLMLMRGTPLGLATIYRLLKLLVSGGVALRAWQENCGNARAVYRHCAAWEPGTRLRVRRSPDDPWTDIDDPALRESLLQALRRCGLTEAARWEIEVGGQIGPG